MQRKILVLAALGSVLYVLSKNNAANNTQYPDFIDPYDLPSNDSQPVFINPYDAPDFTVPEVSATPDAIATVQTVSAPITDFLTNPISTIMDTISNTTRGERNNNPGNIVKNSIAWEGMAPDQSGDSRFVVFQTPEFGIRALGKILHTYTNRGWNTVRLIINHYAPPSENNTSAYVNDVAAHMRVTPDEFIDLNNPDTLANMINAIIFHENGRNIYAASGSVQTGISMIG